MDNTTRETTLVYLSNEDLEYVGYDPALISDEVYNRIVDDMEQILNEGFQHRLLETLRLHAPKAKNQNK